MTCPYHNIDHNIDRISNLGIFYDGILKYNHNGCEDHGHCLHPIICTLHKSCPCNKSVSNKSVSNKPVSNKSVSNKPVSNKSISNKT